MSDYNFLSTRVVRLRNVTIDGRHEDVNFEEASRKRANCARHQIVKVIIILFMCGKL